MKLTEANGTTFYAYYRNNNMSHPWAALAWDRGTRQCEWLGTFSDMDGLQKRVQDRIKLQSVADVSKRNIHVLHEPSNSAIHPWRVREDIRSNGKRVRRIGWGCYTTREEALARAREICGQPTIQRVVKQESPAPIAKKPYGSIPLRYALTEEELTKLLEQAKMEERELINARWKAKLLHLQEVVRDLP